MSDRVYQVIGEIKEKAIGFQQQYVVERSKNEMLQKQIVELQEQISAQAETVAQLNVKVASLVEEAKAKENQAVTETKEQQLSNEEIDDLVKEIEYCIAQLKQ